MKTSINRIEASDSFVMLFVGDANEITSLLAVLRAGGDCTIAELIGKRNAKNPNHVRTLRECLHSLYNSLIPVGEKFRQYIQRQ